MFIHSVAIVQRLSGGTPVTSCFVLTTKNRQQALHFLMFHILIATDHIYYYIEVSENEKASLA